MSGTNMSTSMEQARFNMVEQQVRPWNVVDEDVLRTLRSVPREDFVQPEYRRLAFSDVRIPVGHDQVMMKPVEEGRMLQALAIQPGERVLEIGTGSGFIAACLANLGATVLTVEIFEDLVEQARGRFEQLDIANVEVRQGDVLGEFEPGETFDAVVVTGSMAGRSPRVARWGSPGGRVLGGHGSVPSIEAVLRTRLDRKSTRLNSS